MRRSLYIMICLPLLAGCEPERGIRASRDFASKIDVTCVDQTLRKTFGSVERWDYVSDGGTFPKGTAVAQLAYEKWDEGEGWMTIHIGQVGERYRISHEFTGFGAELPQASFPAALLAMDKASAALQSGCRINLSALRWREIGQDVDALN
ncbi:MAG: hypothetical protein U1D66_03830 [Erythrobacter sp.]|nr:hypothetical protein [Erythrobacter sp.]